MKLIYVIPSSYRSQQKLVIAHQCPGLRLKGTTHINSPFLHISIDGCQNVDIGNLHISAPENSPNTDGIDISGSSHVHIHDSNIQTGDDCVAINGGVVDLNVTNVDCGPGHGISIGSLGENKQHDTVEQVRVQNCNITGTTNGLRIKTVPNGTGYARGIRFQDINLVNVGNPIIIDQHYCNGNISSSDFDNHVCPPQGFFVVVFLTFCYIISSPETASAATFDVTSYGAKGDGTTDDSQLLGSITAPKTLEGWKNCPQRQFWIYFSMVQGLAIEGPGQIDGQGSAWWRVKESTETCDRPSALHFFRCPGLRLKGTTHINSPFLHISIDGCQNVDIGNLHISAPENSPNTDGIDISGSSHVHIHDSNIQTGDDCVAINGGVVDLNVTNVDCGPGHGISIGSLGENNQHDTVEQVRVQNCNITGTTNGLRIKTVPNGTGYARGIIFQDINLVNVENPIIIDQHYCNGNITSNFDNHVCPPQPSAEAVQVSDVTYTNIHGSSAANRAIVFDCSEKYKCTGIVTNNVHISGGGIAYCKNTQGQFVDTIPNVSCD
ncbi:hypothetical protein SSX86_001160 [Deinandra increscens subsp. villosa]|uniref:Glycoside hydrolase family 28 n=1 Tax=Deinandra increscens subsp. villosa TaxID=3103831 RepID=A0AAP0DUG8_9ASTR